MPLISDASASKSVNMYCVMLISLLALFGPVIALSDVNQQCITENSEPYSNDNLIGTVYMIWKFTLFGSMVPFQNCPERIFSRPSAVEIQEYKNKYNDPNQPFNIDDNPVKVTDGFNVDGMIFGHNIAKFYVLNPNSTMVLGWDEYVVNAYRQLTPKFIMYTECALRGHIRWLLTNDRYAPVEEIEEVIKNTPELSRMEQQRFCATY